MSLLVALGPILLPTLKGDVTEIVGEQLEAVGAGVVAGERRPRPFPLVIPVHADRTDANRFAVGLRMRRQVRALLENSTARLQGLYLDWSVDEEMNGWLLVGGGELKYGPGGVSFADFELSLTDCYRVANTRTHRSARRIIMLDRREPSIARDYLGERFSSSYASVSASQRHYLGVNVTDVRVGSTGAPATVATMVTRDGNLTYADNLANGEIVDFEQAEGDMNKAIVRVYDDRGVPGTEASWEAVYGPDQPLLGAPLMDNAACRAVVDAATGFVNVWNWSGSAWVLNATVTPAAGASGFAARVLEWTPDRAALFVTMQWAGVRGEMYVTLQRGWTGPRVELYARNATGTALATLNVYAKTVGDATWQRSNAGPTGIVPGTSIGTFVGLEPWVALVGPGTDLGVAVASIHDSANLRGAALSGREGLAFEGSAHYASVWLAVGPRGTAATDADTHGGRHLLDSQQVPELVARV